MAIVKMKKFSFLTFEGYKNELLKKLQVFGDIQFRNLQADDAEEFSLLSKDSSDELVLKYESDIANVKFTLDKLAPYVEKPGGIKAMMTPPPEFDFETFDSFLSSYDYSEAYSKIKEQEELIVSSKTEISRIAAENENLKVWRKFDSALAPIEQLKTAAHIFGSVSKVAADSFRKQAEEEYPLAYLEIVTTIKEDTVFLIILPKEQLEDASAYFKTLGFSKIALPFRDVPAETIQNNETAIAGLKEQQEKALSEVVKLTEEFEKLQVTYDYYKSALEREKVCENFMKTDKTVLFEGWVPGSELLQLIQMIETVCGSEYYLTENDVEHDDLEVPIKFKNNKAWESFENITSMYSYPLYNEIDPTPFFAPFYMMTFGLMVGDTGYGLVMVAATLIALKFFSHTESQKRTMRFFCLLGVATVLSGFIYSSFFGFSFFTPLNGGTKPIIDSQDPNDIVLLLVASIGFGVVQILFGLVIKGAMLIRDKKYWAAFFDSFCWILTVASGIGMILGVVFSFSDLLASVMKYCFFGGMVVLALSQGRDAKTIGGKLASGLYEVYGLSAYVGDFVSYTRIAALMLSGAYIGFSFTQMANVVPAGFLRAVFGTLIIIFGQTLNFGLAALGAYVHTCRLQFVEFFGKFFGGGGVPFIPFELKNKYINIKLEEMNK